MAQLCCFLQNFCFFYRKIKFIFWAPRSFIYDFLYIFAFFISLRSLFIYNFYN